MEGVSIPFDKYKKDSDNMVYYYKRQTPNQTITIKHIPNFPTEVDIYNDPRYHDVDTDEEIDMDYYEETGEGSNKNEEDEDDLLNKLTKYLSTIPTMVNVPIPVMNVFTEEVPKRLTKKKRLQHIDKRKTKHANRALPRSSY